MSSKILDRKYTTAIYDGYSPSTENHPNFYAVELRTVRGSVATLELPFRPLPDPEQAISLLMTLQSPHSVIHRLSMMLTEQVTDWHPDTIIGIPTLGFPLAWEVSDRLGLPDFVALTNSLKYWQDQSLVTMVESVTSAPKPICLDPYLVDRVAGRRVVVIDDVANTGISLKKSIDLVSRAKPADVKVALVLTEGHKWQGELEEINFPWRTDLRALGHIPTFQKTSPGFWKPNPSTI
ncbi:phosphoribosyltransferase [Patescibacteria group bacterium]|nr:phosphoribosyltransferase [Patescibacteria group bacterium]